MNNVVVGCAKKVVLVALLFCLLNAGVLNAMEEELLDQQLVSSSTVQQKAVPKVDCDTCFSSLSFPESWKPSKWSFSFPESWHYSKWSFKNKKQKIAAQLPAALESKKSESVDGDRVENYEDDESITDKELTYETINRQNSAAPIDSGGAMVYRSSLPKIESSSDASVDTIVERSIIRMLFVEDDVEISESIEIVLKKYNEDLSKKYKIDYKFLTHGFFAVDYLLSFENILPHIIVTDNNMESFYLNYALNSEMRQLGEDDKFYLDVTAGCELGKFLRPERHKSGGGLSMYSYVRVKEVARNNFYTKIKKDVEHTYERVHYECTYSDELSLFSIEPFECLLFLSTSDGPAELGPANIALFDGLPPKLRYGPTFNKFLKEYEPRIDDLIGRY